MATLALVSGTRFIMQKTSNMVLTRFTPHSPFILPPKMSAKGIVRILRVAEHLESRNQDYDNHHYAGVDHVVTTNTAVVRIVEPLVQEYLRYGGISVALSIIGIGAGELLCRLAGTLTYPPLIHPSGTCNDELKITATGINSTTLILSSHPTCLLPIAASHTIVVGCAQVTVDDIMRDWRLLSELGIHNVSASATMFHSTPISGSPREHYESAGMNSSNVRRGQMRSSQAITGIGRGLTLTFASPRSRKNRKVSFVSGSEPYTPPGESGNHLMLRLSAENHSLSVQLQESLKAQIRLQQFVSQWADVQGPKLPFIPELEEIEDTEWFSTPPRSRFTVVIWSFVVLEAILNLIISWSI